MSRHPVPIKRRKRQRIGWTIFAIVCIALIVVMWRLICPDEAEAAEEKPLSEETTLHPQDFVPLAVTVILSPTPTAFRADFSDEEITAMAKTVWGEARGIESRMEQAAVVWCVLNRCDKYGTSLGETVTAPNQFHYGETFPTVDDYGRDLTELVRDVISRWEREKNGQTDVGRVLPSDYIYFGGDGQRNYFRNDFNFDGDIWDWSLPDPYEELG